MSLHAQRVIVQGRCLVAACDMYDDIIAVRTHLLQKAVDSVVKDTGSADEIAKTRLVPVKVKG
jgi:hypothetical protein